MFADHFTTVLSLRCLFISLKHPEVKFVLDSYVCVSVREKTACERHRETALASTHPSRPRPSVGQYIPTCDHNGAYTPMQCHESTGQCWCVDLNGQEIAQTRTRQGIRPTCKNKPENNTPQTHTCTKGFCKSTLFSNIAL